MNEKTKVGLIVPNLQSGGAERVLSITSELLSKAGHDVYFFLFDSDNISYRFSGTLIDLKSKPKESILLKLFQRVKRIIKLSYYKNKYDLDVVMSFLYSANVVNYFSFGKAKKILACRGYGDYLENGQKYNAMLERIDALLVQTERMKEEMCREYDGDKNKIHVIYNPFYIDNIQKSAGENVETEFEKFINSHKTICSVGSFKKDKGFWHLIKAFYAVKETIPNAGLVIIGHRGKLESEIKRMVETSIYKDDIMLLGYRKNPFKYISKCDLYVCSSLYEGFPNALVEAMACGIPVVSTDCKTGPGEILCQDIDNKDISKDVSLADYGVLIPPLEDTVDYSVPVTTRGEKILAEAIILILSNEKLNSRYSELSLKRAKDFNSENYGKEIEKILMGCD